jgi:hypothetical protein
VHITLTKTFAQRANITLMTSGNCPTEKPMCLFLPTLSKGKKNDTQACLTAVGIKLGYNSIYDAKGSFNV